MILHKLYHFYNRTSCLYIARVEFIPFNSVLLVFDSPANTILLENRNLIFIQLSVPRIPNLWLEPDRHKIDTYE